MFGFTTLGKPYEPAVSAGNLWIVANALAKVVKLDPGTGTFTEYSGTGTAATGICHSNGNVWVSNNGSTCVYRVSPGGTVTGFTGTGAFDVASDGTDVWICHGTVDNAVSKVTPSGTVTKYTGTCTNPARIAFDGTDMWVVSGSADAISKITPSGTITTYTGMLIPTNCNRIIFAYGSLWVGGSANPNIYELDLAGNLIGAYDNFYYYGRSFAAYGGHIYTCGAKNVMKFSPSTHVASHYSVFSDLSFGVTEMGGDLYFADPNTGGFGFIYNIVKMDTNVGIISGFNNANFSNGTFPMYVTHD